MERNSDARRTSVVGSNGFSRRRHRTNSLRDSPDGEPELQESLRLTEGVKNDPDRDSRERSSRSKRRRAGRLTTGDDTSDDEGGSFHGGGTSFCNISNNNHHLQHRHALPPSSSAKVIGAPPVWKPSDEIIGVSVPRKARSVSTKRSHDWISSSNNSSSTGNPNPVRPSSSPARQSHLSTPAPPSSKSLDHVSKPPKASSSSNPEELEIEIAEVLYGLMTQSQSQSQGPSFAAPKRKKPRQLPEDSSPEFSVRSSPLSASQTAKSEILSPPNPMIISGSAAENGSEMKGILVVSQVPTEPVKMDSESGEELRESRDLINGVSSSKEMESSVVRDQDRSSQDSPLIAIATPSSIPKTINANTMATEDENPKDGKFEIDMMALPRHIRSTPEMSEMGKIASGSNGHSTNVAGAKGKKAGEGEPNKAAEKKSRNLDFCIDLANPSFSASENKSELPTQKHQPSLNTSKEGKPLPEKPGCLTSSLPLTMPVASFHGGLPQMGYMAPLQRFVPPAHIQPFFSQPRPKRCVTHCHIARYIQCHQQLMKTNPFWSAAADSKGKETIPNSMNFNMAILQNNAYPFTIPTVGPFYSPQMMHQQLQHSMSAGQMMQAHHNTSTGNNSSSSQKQQKKSMDINSSQKAQPPPRSNQYMQGGGNDDNNLSSVADNRTASMNIYGQNFTLPVHLQNFAMMTPPNSNNHAEKRFSSQGMKTGVESLPPHTFAMSFGTSVDGVSKARSNTTFQNCSEGARKSIQMMSDIATQAAQKNFQISEEAKSGSSRNSFAKENDRKSFAFADTHGASIQATNYAVQNVYVQAQLQQQQMLKLKQPQQQMSTNTTNLTNKAPVTSNGSIHSDHLNSSPMISGNFPKTVSPVFPQNLVQSSNSPTPSQSPHWKSSTRTPATSSQAAPSSLGISTPMLHKNLPQQHSKNQPPMQAQISFGGTQKQPATPQSPSSSMNSPSILGNQKAQMQQQSQQKNMQQTHLFFSNSYSQPPHLTSAGHAAAVSSGYCMPQRGPAGTRTNDPATAIAAATSKAKGVSPFGVQSTGTLLPAGFSYVHPVPAGVQVKPVEQRQLEKK